MSKNQLSLFKLEHFRCNILEKSAMFDTTSSYLYTMKSYVGI